MMKTTFAALFAAATLLAVPVQAQEFDAADFTEARAECTAWMEDMGPDGWAGWQRNYGTGYGDNVHFYNGRADERGSLLDVVKFIDGGITEGTTWCWRVDGSLATIEIVMAAPDINSPTDVYIVREGRLYFDENGEVLSVQGWISDTMGEKIGAIDSQENVLARGCNPVDVRPNVADAERELVSVLGDMEGNKPSYEPTLYDWCADAVEGEPAN